MEKDSTELLQPIMPRTLYIIAGPDGSCTRLVTRMFIKAGCYGQAPGPGNDSRGAVKWKLQEVLDGLNTIRAVAHDAKKLAIRVGTTHKSSNQCPPYRAYRTAFANECKIFWVILVRRPCRYNYSYHFDRGTRFYPPVFSLIHEHNDDFCILDTSLMFKDPENVLYELGQCTGLDFSGFDEPIYDADKKWEEKNIKLA